MSWAMVAVGAGTAIVGGVQAASASKRAKKADAENKALFARRKAYKTPKEVLDLVGLSQARAQTGYDPLTMDYLTSQSNRATSGALGTARQLGAGANDVSAILDQSFQNIFRIGAENQMMQLKNFDRLFNSINLLGQNKDAVWASQENLLKDQMQLTAAQAAAAEKEKQSGVNLMMQGASSAVGSFLYSQPGTKGGNGVGSGNSGKYTPPPITNPNGFTPSQNANQLY